MHVPRAKRRGVNYVTKQLQYLGNYLADYAETSHACRHPPGNASLCVTVGIQLHVRTCKATMFQISRTAEPIALKLGILTGTV